MLVKHWFFVGTVLYLVANLVSNGVGSSVSNRAIALLWLSLVLRIVARSKIF